MIKKAQSQIITTVLIILLVLAAVVIVWQVVRTTVIEGTETLTERTACIGLSLDITSFSLVGTNSDELEVKVTRNAGGPDDDNDLTLVLLVDGVTQTYTEGSGAVVVKQLESATLTYPGYGSTIAPTKVQVGGKIGKVACDYLDVCTNGANC